MYTYIYIIHSMVLDIEFVVCMLYSTILYTQQLQLITGMEMEPSFAC